MSIKKICLIGGSGFIGSYIAERLAEQNLQLSIASRQPERHKAKLSVLPNVQLIQADIHQPAALARLLEGQDALISMVGILHGSRQQFEHAHVALSEKILNACQQQGVHRLIHISALGADADAISHYQQTKAIAEQKIRASGLDWTILRPSVVFGQGDSFLNLFAKLLRKLPVLPLAGASTHFAPIWADDVAKAVRACLHNPATYSRSLDLTGPQTYTLAELVKLVGRYSGHARPVLPIPTSLAMLQAGIMECLPGPTLMSRDNVRSLGSDNVSPHPFPSELLGFTPTALEALAPALLGEDEFNHIVSRYRAEH
ncbi:complex I NDUFA9 subunit family protein [Neisseriaceae bacterium TC5R-5]|nr:complex I NDUFA9 subunit family protein [Neisseriaceae bacterium TC5R-5]